MSRGSRDLRKWFRNDNSMVIHSGGFALQPMSYGTAFYVNPDHINATDTDNPGTDPDRPLSTIPVAYGKMTTNKDDVCYISANSTHTLTSMLTISKNRCHFVGVGPLREYGQGCKISLGVTTAATDLGTILNTGVRNSFTNIKFMNSNTVAEGIYCFLDGGEYTVLDHCEIYKSTDLDGNLAAEFVANGDSSQYLNCTFGSLADARSGAVARPNVLFTQATAAAGKVARDVLFKDCRFWIQCTNTGNRFMYGANATDIERICEITSCKFIKNGASSQDPAQNIAFGAALTVGHVLVTDPSTNCTTAISTTTGVFVQGAVPTAATSGIAVQAA